MKKTSILILIFLIYPYIAYSACNIVNGKKYGNCNHVTVTINKSNPESLIISSYKNISGITKDIQILSGGDAHVSGISGGNIIIEKGGRLTFSGSANSITNNGGVLIHTGVANSIFVKSGITKISGVVTLLYGEGEVQIESGSVVNGKINE